MEKKIWIGFFVVLVLVGLTGRVNATIVPETSANRWIESSDIALTGRVETLDVFGPGYWFGVIIVGERERWRLKDNYYNLLDARYNNGYYNVLDEGVCRWDLNGKQFWNELSCLYVIDGQPYSPLLNGEGRAVIMSEPDYWAWIDQNYYRALDQGVWVVPEPATIVLLGLGGLILLFLRKRKR